MWFARSPVTPTKRGRMTQCEETMQRLWEFLDGELEPVSEQALQHHLEVCARCYPRYNFQRSYFKIMHQIRDRDPLPRKLRIRLLQQILAEDAPIGQDDSMVGRA
jgi:mycothiol system anti-sigma-R factor